MRQLAAAFLPASLLAGFRTRPPLLAGSCTRLCARADGCFTFRPASRTWLVRKRQQAAALQSFAPCSRLSCAARQARMNKGDDAPSGRFKHATTSSQDNLRVRPCGLRIFLRIPRARGGRRSDFQCQRLRRHRDKKHDDAQKAIQKAVEACAKAVPRIRFPRTGSMRYRQRSRGRSIFPCPISPPHPGFSIRIIM